MTGSLTIVRETKEKVKFLVGKNTATLLHIFRLKVEVNFVKATLH